MATYATTLPQVFPYRLRCRLDNLASIVIMLSMPRTNAPCGSSFAVTSDAPDGYRFVWLSEASYRTFTEEFGQTISEEQGGIQQVGPAKIDPRQ
jgi:hypothetical protein